MKGTALCWIVALAYSLPAVATRKATETHSAGGVRVQYGTASWYGEREQGRLMASGKPFNMYAMIAANRTLPLGTRVEVTNLRNGRSVVVRIMDRGPRPASRAIDLSKAAANRLGFTHQGLTRVRIIVLSAPRREGDLAASSRPSP